MKALIVFFAILCLVSPCFAQDAQPGTGGDARRILFSLSRESAGELTDGQALMISRSMLARLQAASSEIIVLERPASIGAPSVSDLSADARGRGADGWVSVIISGTWESMRIGVRAFDLRTSSMVVDRSFARAGSSLGELPREGWDDMVQVVAPQFHAALPGAQAPSGAPQARLTIRAIVGTRVTGAGTGALVIGPDGVVTVDLPASREYLLRGELAGYSPSTARIFLSGSREVVLRQERSARWAMEASLQDLGYPRIDAAWFPGGGSAYVKLGLTTYLVGLALDSTEVLSSTPLTNVEAQMGLFLNPADSLFRVSFGIGCFVRVVHVPEVFFGPDPLSPWGIRGIIGVEISGAPRSRFFVELTPTVYMTPAPDALRQFLGSGDIPFGWLRGNGSFVDVVSLRCGYRWLL